jgi:glycosyltransferase involved in cell wall biosynthesis
MHVVVSHGYFLKGTGSNLFVKNICRELCKMGHRVSLLCQENDIVDIDFIEKAFDVNGSERSCKLFHSKETCYQGKCTLYRPALSGFLPVYVYDQYQGYRVKEFISCSRHELERYIDFNQSALNWALKGAKPDVVWTNHTIMQPVYVSRSDVAKNDSLHVMTVHGSCLNFAVRKSLMLTEYAWESIEYADKITFVSDYSKNEFLEYFKNSNKINAKSCVIPAGVDLDSFMPLDGKATKSELIKEMLQDIAEKRNQEKNADIEDNESSWKTDSDIVEKISSIDFEREKIVLYYGKYLWTKGLQLLIAAVPIVLNKHQDARFVFVGYGSSRVYFEAMVDALDSGDRDQYMLLLNHAEKFDQGIDSNAARYFSALVQRLNDADFADEYFASARNKIRSAVVFTGFLSHDHLKALIACADIATAPSIFPEAFGLVAVEALSAGIIPMQTNHSGFSEVIKKYVDEFSDVFDIKKLNPLYLDDNLALNIANNLSIMLTYYSEMSQPDRQLIRKRARKVSEQNYSWRSIVERYLQLKTTKG